MSGPLGSFLRTVGTISEAVLREQRTVTIDGYPSGRLVAVFERKDEAALVLMVGGQRVFTAFLPNETPVEVHLQPRRAAQ